MKFCPLNFIKADKDTPENELRCSVNCAWYAQNHECAIYNLGNIRREQMGTSIGDKLDKIADRLQNC